MLTQLHVHDIRLPKVGLHTRQVALPACRLHQGNTWDELFSHGRFCLHLQESPRAVEQ